MSKSWFTARNAGTVGEIAIYSEIGSGGITAEAFHAALSSLRGVSTLIISINSDGGDVSTGFAIANMLERFNARRVVRIDGAALSMASVIAMVGHEIVMPSNAMMMIHNPWGATVGGAEQLKSFANALEMMQVNIVTAYAKRTGIDPARIQEMMDAETWLSAEEAVRLGFADRVEGELKAAALAGLPDISKFKNAPSVPRGMDAVREEAYRRFNRRRTSGGATVNMNKEGRRVRRNS